MKRYWYAVLPDAMNEHYHAEKMRKKEHIKKSSYYQKTCRICGKKLNDHNPEWNLCPSCYEFIKRQNEPDQKKRKSP